MPFRTWTVPLAAALTLTVAVADEPDYTGPVVDKAIAAVGKADLQKKLAAVVVQWEFAVDFGGEKGTVTGTWSVEGLDRIRADLHITADNENASVSLAVSGGQAWATGGPNNEVRKIDLAKDKDEAREIEVLQRLVQTVRLLQRPAVLPGGDWKLSHTGEWQVNGRDAVGVKAAPKSGPEVNLLYDKESGLPLKGAVRIEGPDQQQFEISFLPSEFRDVNGLKLFSRLAVQLDGAAVGQIRLTDIELREKLDDATFQAP